MLHVIEQSSDDTLTPAIPVLSSELRDNALCR
jgi:hypothetical protein